jgi:phosphotransacetylase
LQDAPLASDSAIPMRVAATKGIKSAVAGQANNPVAPDLEAGNMIAKHFKQLINLAGTEAADIVMEAQVSIILTSRADDRRTRVASAIVAGPFNHAKRR